MTIGKAYGSAKIEVQECSANRLPTKESLKAVCKNKPKKVLMCNYCASKIGAQIGARLQSIVAWKTTMGLAILLGVS